MVFFFAFFFSKGCLYCRMAYMDFPDVGAFNKALEKNGAEIGEHYLTVEEAKARVDFGDSGGRG